MIRGVPPEAIEAEMLAEQLGRELASLGITRGEVTLPPISLLGARKLLGLLSEEWDRSFEVEE